MYCITCLGICVEDILSGKPYEHLTFIKLQSSATSGCLLCKFLIQKVTLGLRRPLDTANPLNIFLEQHSSDKQAMRRNFRHTEQILRLNADDDNFRDVNIGTHSGYNSTLIAVVARPESAPAIGATVEEQEVSYVTLEFSTDSGEREGIFDKPVARRVMQNPGNPRCYDMISNWIQTCWKDHQCGPTGDMPLPTRILEIGARGAVNLRLIISSGLHGRYVALSHCWGKRPTATTTNGNIAERLKAINLGALPANFRDAVIITRELGYKYLWIDSLCIIQGDREDWITQSSLMGSVYHNCSVMLAASGSLDSYGGMLNPRQESCALPNSPLFLSPKRKPFQILEESELGSRAWASQERILAPRIVYYSTEQIFWECRDSRRAEASVERLSDTFQSYNKRYHDHLHAKENYANFLSKSSSTVEDDGDIYTARPEGWFWAIQGYSRRHLTNPSDKLPALSGLAQNVFHPRRATGGEYLAGIWANDILRQLLWENGEDQVTKFSAANYVPVSKFRTITILSKSSSYRAPSWSWVAYDGPIENDRADDHIVLNLDTSADQWERSRILDLQVVGTDIRFASNDPFGEILEGSSIVVEGICQFVTFRPGEKTFFTDGEVECLWSLDIKKLELLNGEYLCLQVARRHGQLRTLGNLEDIVKHRLHVLGVRCLVLRAAGRANMWQRVGVLTFDVVGEADNGWKKKNLTLI